MEPIRKCMATLDQQVEWLEGLKECINSDKFKYIGVSIKAESIDNIDNMESLIKLVDKYSQPQPRLFIVTSFHSTQSDGMAGIWGDCNWHIHVICDGGKIFVRLFEDDEKNEIVKCVFKDVEKAFRLIKVFLEKVINIK